MRHIYAAAAKERTVADHGAGGAASYCKAAKVGPPIHRALFAHDRDDAARHSCGIEDRGVTPLNAIDQKRKAAKMEPLGIRPRTDVNHRVIRCCVDRGLNCGVVLGNVASDGRAGCEDTSTGVVSPSQQRQDSALRNDLSPSESIGTVVIAKPESDELRDAQLEVAAVPAGRKNAASVTEVVGIRSIHVRGRDAAAGS
jgi:hypothetical protein